MRRITLRNTPLEVSAVGFGCVGLTAHPHRTSALQSLAMAFDHGITHFDVARAYGFGHAEGILGEFLKTRRDRVTVTTKLGIQPSVVLSRAGGRLLGVAKRLVRSVPALERQARRVTRQVGRGGAFTVEEARRSLTTSLRALGTDYVDVLLLHECTLADAANEDLVRFLQDQVSAGTVRCFGVGTSFSRLQGEADLVHPAYHVLQFENSAVSRNLATLRGAERRAIITHSALKDLPRLVAAARHDSAVTRRHADELGADLEAPEVLLDFLLQYATQANPEGVVLFGTANHEHLRANIRSLSRVAYTPAQLAAFTRFADEVLTAAAA